MKKVIVFILIGLGLMAAGYYERFRGTESLNVDLDSGSVYAYVDTFPLGSAYGYKTATGSAILTGPVDSIGLDSTVGGGLADTGYIILKAKNGLMSYTLDSVKKASVPCTLRVAVGEAIGDTLILPDIFMIVRVGDTVTPLANITAQYKCTYDITLK